jgi:hypothetical protein
MTLTPHSIINGDACFAYFNKIWGIPGILQGCLFSGVAAPHVALIDFTMHHPFGHCLSWAAHEADAIFHDSPKTLGSATRYPRSRH